MTWRIRESGHGGYIVESGNYHGGVRSPHGNGYTMPGFLVYQSARFDTMAKAKKFIEKNSSERV